MESRGILHTVMLWSVAFICFIYLWFIPNKVEGGLFEDLNTVRKIDEKREERLPFFHNASMMGGYFNMPSARVPKEGVVGLGAIRVPPYQGYGVSFQYFDRIELSLNYRIYKGIPDTLLAPFGFGDEAERTGNIKLAFNLPEDGLFKFPCFAVGWEDFLGTRRFNALYFVLTQIWNEGNLEVSIGWGKHRIGGWFGGIAWTPFRKTNLAFLSSLSLLAEYDAYNYKNHPHEHPEGREYKTRFNVGVTYLLKDTVQFTVNSVRGQKVAGMVSVRYPLGNSEGLISKFREPSFYRTPIDTEPLGETRSEQGFALELGYAFENQGLDLYQVRWESQGRCLWIKLINNMYREEDILRNRVQDTLAAILPSNIEQVQVVVEADGVLCQGYFFTRELLYRYRQKKITNFEMSVVSPLRDPSFPPRGSVTWFKRKKSVWLMTLRPRFQTFFGSARGKFKYNLSLIATPEGYLFDDIFYEMQLGYSIRSSISDISGHDLINPSQLPHVRSDTILYYQSNRVSLEMGYLQKSWNVGPGNFFRFALGYFEPAYGGIALEGLHYPVVSNWMIGIEGATVWKRRYQGIWFTHHIQRFKGSQLICEPFIGIQYFATAHYILRMWEVDLSIKVGRFLAKDIGIRFEMQRFFSSGLSLSLWYTITNGNDKVNGKTYFDKGFYFSLPLDFFLTRSSRTYVGYGMSAWLRDVGASSNTGKPLYSTIRLERLQLQKQRKSHSV